MGRSLIEAKNNLAAANKRLQEELDKQAKINESVEARLADLENQLDNFRLVQSDPCPPPS